MTLKEARAVLNRAGVPDADYDAREIFRAIGGFSPAALMLGAESDDPKLLDAVNRRAAREPLGYILGEVGFYGDVYRVTPDVLIPRPDTETLVEAAVARLGAGAEFVDLCTGSGCVALSVLRHTKDTRAVAVDISLPALGVAQGNAASLGVARRVRFVAGDVLTDPPITGKFDAVLANPPYVDDDVYPTLAPEVLAEPKAAFVGGADGMTFYRAILAHYHDSLRADGFFAFEIGYDQGEKIRSLAESFGLRAEILSDLGGCDRVAILHPSDAKG